MNYILAYDIGTTGAKSCLFDERLNLVASMYSPYETSYPGPLMVVQRPKDWWMAVSSSTRKLIEKTGVPPSSIACICVDGHMNGCIPVDSKGNLLLDEVFLWADFRSGEEAAIIESEIGIDKFYSLTGGGLDLPIYPAAKIPWIKKNRPDVYAKTQYFLGTKDYINLMLTGNCGTDFSDGSNYGLMDIRKKAWSQEIIDQLGIDGSKLPPLHKSYDVAGNLTKEAAIACGLLPGIPVVVGGGDVPCASVGAGAFRKGVPYINLGSASWFSKTLDGDELKLEETKQNRPFVLCHVVDGLYTSQLVNYGGGICFQWIVDLVAAALGSDANLEMTKERLYAEVEKKKRDGSTFAHQLLFLPYLRGGADFNKNARGAFIGLSLEHDAYDMIYAVQAGVAYHLKHIYSYLFQKPREKPSEICIIGGGARSDAWCRLISDICEMPVVRPSALQTATAKGAAVTGGVGVGLFHDFSVAALRPSDADHFLPDNGKAQYHKKMYDIFLSLLDSLSTEYNILAQIKNDRTN